jgi:hypothetical protein
MRTVSFSSDAVQKSLKTEFVPVVVNITGMPATGASCKHSPREQAGFCPPGVGHQNVQCLFLTPDGEIFHAVTGHQSPQALADELDNAARLFAKMKENPDQARETVAESHRDALAAAGPAKAPGVDVMGLFGGSFRRRKDAKFCIDHPLISWQDLQRRPQLLVGDESTFFISKAGGAAFNLGAPRNPNGD